MHGHYRRFVLQLYRRFRHPRRLKQSRFMRWFARHFLDKTVWKPTRHSFAGGLAVGLFMNMLLVPGQMPIAAVLCALMRVNIPIAVVACWISNPVTFAPMAWWEINFGNWIMETVGFGTPMPLNWGELTSLAKESEGIWNFFKAVKPWAASLYLGGLVGGCVLAPIGYLLAYVFWDFILMMSHRRKKIPAGS